MVTIVTGGHIRHMWSHLHAEEGGDQDEEEEEQQERDDGLEGAEQGDHEVSEGRPISVTDKIVKLSSSEFAYFVTLNILKSLKALRTESPKDPAFGLK